MQKGYLGKLIGFLDKMMKARKKICMEKRMNPSERKEIAPTLAQTLSQDNPDITRRYSCTEWLDRGEYRSRSNPYRHEAYDVKPQKEMKIR